MSADSFWLGDLLNTRAEKWISYWTVKQGSFVTSEFKDAAIGQALQFLSQVGRADQNRLLVLRSGSDYTVQPDGQTPAEFPASEVSGTLSGFRESLNDVYEVGSIVVKKLSSDWKHLCGSNSLSSGRSTIANCHEELTRSSSTDKT